MVSVGDIVTIPHKRSVWVAADRRPSPSDAEWWRFIQGWRDPTSFSCWASGVVVVLSPTFDPGTKLRHIGFDRPVTVLEDHGALVRCSTPTKRVPLPGGDFLRFPAGEAELSKAALVAANVEKLLEVAA